MPATFPMMAAMAPPRSAAPTLVTGSRAYCSEKSSLRCSGRLCSMRNGDWTTKHDLAGGSHRGREREDADRGRDHDEAGDGDRRATGPEGQHDAPSEAVREDARGKATRTPASGPDRAADPDERGVEAEGREVQVEVDPPEAEGDAVDERRDEEDAGVALEAGEAPRVAPERAHRVAGSGAGARGSRSRPGRLTGFRSAVGAAGDVDAGLADPAESRDQRRPSAAPRKRPSAAVPWEPAGDADAAWGRGGHAPVGVSNGLIHEGMVAAVSHCLRVHAACSSRAQRPVPGPAR